MILSPSVLLPDTSIIALVAGGIALYALAPLYGDEMGRLMRNIFSTNWAAEIKFSESALVKSTFFSIGKLLVLDALLYVLVVEIELADVVIAAVAAVVVRDDGLERSFLLVRVHFVVCLLRRQIFLNLLHIGVSFRATTRRPVAKKLPPRPAMMVGRSSWVCRLPSEMPAP